MNGFANRATYCTQEGERHGRCDAAPNSAAPIDHAPVPRARLSINSSWPLVSQLPDTRHPVGKPVVYDSVFSFGPEATESHYHTLEVPAVGTVSVHTCTQDLGGSRLRTLN